MQMLSVGERGYGNTRYTRVNILPQDLNTQLNYIKFNSKHKVVKHSLLQHDG
jgi:hypothetical protein